MTGTQRSAGEFCSRTVILAGGLGTRLRPLTFSIPKPLLPVGEKPILETILKQLQEVGVQEVILAVGYRAELLRTYFRDGAQIGLKIVYVEEQERLGTAGPLALAHMQYPFAVNESFLVMNGDILTSLDFRRLYRYHQEGGYEITVATRTFRNQLAFGTLQIENGQIVSITEKPTIEYEINAGIYMFQGAVLDDIPRQKFFDIPDLINKLLEQGRKVGAYHFDDYWLAIERLEHIEQAEEYLRQHGLQGATK